MKKKWYGLLLGCMILTGCGAKGAQIGESSNEIQTSAGVSGEYNAVSAGDTEGRVNVPEGRIDTHSEYTSSFRKNVGEEKEVVYLGMPRKLSFDETAACHWSTSDGKVATVEDGIVTGLREGVVTIQQLADDTGKVLGSWDFAVTTFNDGKQVEASYELGRAGFQNSDIEYTGTVDPALLKLKINTIQDVICYFQESGFEYIDSPILMTDTSQWIWTLPGEAVLWSRGGGSSEMANAASYLLQYDFEDWGYILKYGKGSGVYSWFYEDGNYYIMNFGEILVDMMDGFRDREYQPYKADSIEGVKQYVMDTMNPDTTFAVIMVSALGHTDQPATYWSFLHDTYTLYENRAEVRMEECVYETMTILYESEENGFTFTPVPTHEMPPGVPGYGDAEGNRYQYEPEK